MKIILRLSGAALLASLLAACGGGAGQTSSAVPNGGLTAQSSDLAMQSVFTGRGDAGQLATVLPTREVINLLNATQRHSLATNNLTWHGGPVQHTPKIYIVYWGWNGSDPSGVAARMQSFYSGTGGSRWQSSQTQYTDSTGNVGNQANEFVSTWSDNSDALPRRLTQSALAAEAVRAVSHFGGSYSVSTNYIIASPHGHSMSGFATQWCGWHSSTSSSSGTVSYTYMPYMPDGGASCGANSVNSNGALDGVTIVGGHEQDETMTDPQPNSGWLDSSGAENGDKCAWTNLQNTPFSTGTFPTQPLWSNAAGGCVQ